MQNYGGKIFVVLLALLLGFVAGTRSDELYRAVAPVLGIRVPESSINVRELNDTYAALLRYYDGDLSLSDAADGAKKGLVEATGDPYTVYLTAKEAEQFNDELNGEIGAGIGAEIAVRFDQPTVVRVLVDHPARAAGVQAGDVIHEVNGDSMDGKTAAETAEKIRGEEGTTVKLTVLREGEKKAFTITRKTIDNPSVQSEIKADNIGYIKITRFDDQTADLARQAAQDLLAGSVNRIVLDLRGNGGGSLDASVDVAGLWLNDKVVVSERKEGTTVKEIRTGSDAVLAGTKTIVLVDESSASASEIVAGALQDHGAATLVGKTTFGKGTVQQLVNLEGGAVLKVTIARWYTPSGRSVTDGGIKPDKAVDTTGEQINKGKDPQLDAALKAAK